MNHEEGRLPGQGPAPNTQVEPEPPNRNTRPIAQLARVSASVAVLAVAAGFARSLARGEDVWMAIIVILAAAALIAVLLPMRGRS